MTKAKREPVPTEVEWERPPDYRVARDWAAVADQLKAHPGEWAKVFDDGPTSTANSIRQGDNAVIHPSLGFEVRTANNVKRPRRRCTLYLRYVPKED